MNKEKLYWACQLIGWSVFGVLQISLSSVSASIDQSFLAGQVVQVVLYIILSHLFRWLILNLGWLKYKWYQVLPLFLAGTFVISMLHFIAVTLYYFFIGEFIPSKDLNSLSIVANLLVSTGLLLVWSLLYLSFHYFERYNKSLQSEAALKEVELNNLKSQLNPHFIFNALNSIRALVDENPVKAKSAITQLSNILRNSLTSERKKLVSFEEEIVTVKDYLALESIRYEERLDTSFQIDPASYRFTIPPLMIQTLVENGIKHGISTLKKGGIIQVKTEEIENGLLIQIRNSGKYMNGKPTSLGYGLLNTRKRLELIYGEGARFKIENEKDNIVLTEIVIPQNL
ncbi:MAG: histidine kinase [Cyclobacteriaceae bacterium]|nr:histidine kinase [Cyclobacteriaceae bacterium]